MSGHVLVFGFGLGGQLIAKELRDEGRPYLIVDLNGATVERIRAQGEPALYGDATNPDTLAAAGLPRAGAVVLVMNDPDATLRAVRAIRAQHSTVPVLARTRYRIEAERLLAAGATTVLVEEIETSLEVLARLLACLGLPGDRVEATRAGLRRGLTSGQD